MNSEIYYHILELGIVYEKGGKSGNRWRWRERKRLSDELAFWKNLIKYAELEERGMDCSKETFTEMSKLSHAYKLANYDRVLSLQNNLLNSTARCVIEEEKKKQLISLALDMLSDMEENLKDKKGKVKVYGLMEKLHNIPKALHGKDELGGMNPISFEDALKYAEW